MMLPRLLRGRGRARLSLSIAALAMLPALANCECDSSETTTSGNGGAGGSTTTSTATSQSGGGGSTGNFTGAGGAACMVGAPCDGGICDENHTCCAFEHACGQKCCGTAEVCSFLECLVPGITCTDDKQCAADEFCDFSLGGDSGTGGGGGAGGSGGGPTCIGGVDLPEGKCMPKPPVCPTGTDPGDPPSCVTSCEYHPPTGVFAPELKYSWGVATNTTDNVMMTPIVVQLDDDNCDNVLDEKDIPEIVFLTFDGNDYNNNSGTSSTLHAISIVDGVVVDKLAVKTTGVSADLPGRQIAAGDIDGDGQNEIVTCTKDGRIRAYEADGSVKWLSAAAKCFMPSIADLDQDGMPEIIDLGVALDGATGATKATFADDHYVVVSDVDGDGLLDIVGPTRVYGADGSVKVDTNLAGTHAAVGDLDNDGIPEIVTVDTPTHTVNVWHMTSPTTFEIVRQGLDLNYGIATNPCPVGSAGNTKGGGTPTIADFNGDGSPDVGLAGGIGYVVFDGVALMDTSVAPDQTRLWLTQTQDCSSAQTGSSVFDFDGDGKAEAVYADETTLHIYDGTTGTQLFGTCNTNGTLYEYPVVADVDNDGHADLVVASNSYSGFNCGGVKTTGIRVYGDVEGKWVRTRRVWNEHGYHVTNVEESGAIPKVEAQNWAVPGLNDFRQNVQPSGQFSAPDLVVSLTPICDGPYGLRARVTNIGEAPVEAGVVVGFYEGAAPGTLLGQATTTITLYPLTHEDVVLDLAGEPASNVYAVVDDGMPVHPWHECKTDNDTSTSVSPSCMPPQ